MRFHVVNDWLSGRAGAFDAVEAGMQVLDGKAGMKILDQTGVGECHGGGANPLLWALPTV
ncbi:MAG: hypothetical protein HC904_05240 [Blastochloris sp.]|nr:hypothetical protein [Blastochloris sp.]